MKFSRDEIAVLSVKPPGSGLFSRSVGGGGADGWVDGSCFKKYFYPFFEIPPDPGEGARVCGKQI